MHELTTVVICATFARTTPWTTQFPANSSLLWPKDIDLTFCLCSLRLHLALLCGALAVTAVPTHFISFRHVQEAHLRYAPISFAGFTRGEL